jgi:hypothetical protein
LQIFEFGRALPLEVLAKVPKFDAPPPRKMFEKVFEFEVALFKVFEGRLSCLLEGDRRRRRPRRVCRLLEEESMVEERQSTTKQRS